MKRIEKGWAFLVVSLALGLSARASLEPTESGDRSYQSIVERNPFGLRPPPTNAPPPPTNQNSKSNLKLTGFTTLPEKRAYFVWTDDRSKTNELITLAVNQEKDGLKVLDVDGKSVRVISQGLEKLMTLSTDGLT